MDTQELLTQVTDLLKQHTEVLSDMISDLRSEVKAEIQDVKNEIQDVKNDIQDVKNDIQDVKDDVQKVRLEMEVNVAKRIEALFDGYKLTHERQWEQERKIEELKAQMEVIQMRLALLEEKSA